MSPVRLCQWETCSSGRASSGSVVAKKAGFISVVHFVKHTTTDTGGSSPDERVPRDDEEVAADMSPPSSRRTMGASSTFVRCPTGACGVHLPGKWLRVRCLCRPFGLPTRRVKGESQDGRARTLRPREWGVWRAPAWSADKSERTAPYLGTKLVLPTVRCKADQLAAVAVILAHSGVLNSQRVPPR